MSDGQPSSFDDRIYIRLDQGMPENRKIVGLSDSAFRLYIEAICWCSRQRSNGAIPPAALKKLGPARAVKEITTGPGALLESDGDSWWVHDYLQHNRSSTEIDVIKEAKSDAGNKGAHARWHVGRRKPDPKCDLCFPALKVASGG